MASWCLVYKPHTRGVQWSSSLPGSVHPSPSDLFLSASAAHPPASVAPSIPLHLTCSCLPLQLILQPPSIPLHLTCSCLPPQLILQPPWLRPSLSIWPVLVCVRSSSSSLRGSVHPSPSDLFLSASAAHPPASVAPSIPLHLTCSCLPPQLILQPPSIPLHLTCSCLPPQLILQPPWLRPSLSIWPVLVCLRSSSSSLHGSVHPSPSDLFLSASAAHPPASLAPSIPLHLTCSCLPPQLILQPPSIPLHLTCSCLRPQLILQPPWLHPSLSIWPVLVCLRSSSSSLPGSVHPSPSDLFLSASAAHPQPPWLRPSLSIWPVLVCLRSSSTSLHGSVHPSPSDLFLSASAAHPPASVAPSIPLHLTCSCLPPQLTLQPPWLRPSLSIWPVLVCLRSSSSSLRGSVHPSPSDLFLSASAAHPTLPEGFGSTSAGATHPVSPSA